MISIEPLKPGEPVIVGLSGGADSVALTAILARAGCRVVAAHVNYGLRGAESDRDEAHARAVAGKFGAAFEVLRADVGERCRRHGISVEMACREIRYEWFEELRRRYGAHYVAIGHHREDSVETFFLNLSRGTGVRGLRGISRVNGHIVRPLIELTRAEIEAYVASTGAGFVNDSTNAADGFARNRVRHHVVPALESVCPGALDGLRRTMAILDEDSRLLDNYAAMLRNRYRRGDGWDFSTFDASDPLASAKLYQILAPSGFNRASTDAILTALPLGGERRFGSWRLERKRLMPFETAECRILESEQLGDVVDLSVLPRDRMKEFADGRHLILDASALEGDHRWTLRLWNHGDRIKLLGMNGSRLVSDILKDLHLSHDERRRIRVLTRDSELLWVEGLRQSRLFAVTETTETIAVVASSLE